MRLHNWLTFLSGEPKDRLNLVWIMIREMFVFIILSMCGSFSYKRYANLSLNLWDHLWGSVEIYRWMQQNNIKHIYYDKHRATKKGANKDGNINQNQNLPLKKKSTTQIPSQSACLWMLRSGIQFCFPASHNVHVVGLYLRVEGGTVPHDID